LKAGKTGFARQFKTHDPEILFDPSPPDLELVTAKFKFFAPARPAIGTMEQFADSCKEERERAGGLFLKGTGSFHGRARNSA